MVPARGARVLVTGGAGFVGSALIQRLRQMDLEVRAALRASSPEADDQVEIFEIGDIAAQPDWSRALAGVSCVVHTAARVHVMREAGDPTKAYRRINVDATLRLAREAAKAGVRRFVYLSSIKVNGEETPSGMRFRADDPPAPSDAYAVSKREAEEGLRGIADSTSMELAVIRPPLVYGPGVKANFRELMRWVARGVPLPFGAVRNKRSLVALDNLIDLIATCITHPRAANQVFLASDGADLSTTELLTRVGAALGRPARLFPVPTQLLSIGASLLGRPELSRRLCGSLEIDIAKNRERLDWRPPVSVDSALAATAQRFLSESPAG